MAAIAIDTTNSPRDIGLIQAVQSDALRGLSVPAGQQKTLPPWLFYDEAGSALFERITELPEYYLTAAERSIFAGRADEIVASAGSPLTIAELGSGSASKTGLLLAAATRRQPQVLYQPIDVSVSALRHAAETIAAAVPGVTVRPQAINYITDDYIIDRPETGPVGCCVLALYIGSSIGNFGPEEARSILRKLRKRLNKTGDAALLGIDLAPNCNKNVETLVSAYNDSAGVTAAFNKNILARLNRELGADFKLDTFRHRAFWNAQESRIEMHLESLVAQTVSIGDRRISFALGETIHTENSYKFTERGFREMLHDSGFGSPQWYEDAQDRFGVALAYPA